MCDPEKCNYVTGAVNKPTRMNLAVTCKAQIAGLMYEYDKHYSPVALERLYTDAMTAVNESFFNKLANVATKSLHHSAMRYQRKVAIVAADAVEKALTYTQGTKTLVENVAAAVAVELGLPPASIALSSSAVERTKLALEQCKAEASRKQTDGAMTQSNTTREELRYNRKYKQGVAHPEQYGQLGRPAKTKNGPRDPSKPSAYSATLKKQLIKMHEMNNNILPTPQFQMFVVESLPCYVKRGLKLETLQDLWLKMRDYNAFLALGGPPGKWNGKSTPGALAETPTDLAHGSRLLPKAPGALANN